MGSIPTPIFHGRQAPILPPRVDLFLLFSGGVILLALAAQTVGRLEALDSSTFGFQHSFFQCKIFQ